MPSPFLDFGPLGKNEGDVIALLKKNARRQYEEWSAKSQKGEAK